MNKVDVADKLMALEEKKFPYFRAGDTLRVHVKIKEGNKERVQIFEGVVIKIKRGGINSSFTVRKMAEESEILHRYTQLQEAPLFKDGKDMDDMLAAFTQGAGAPVPDSQHGNDES